MNVAEVKDYAQIASYLAGAGSLVVAVATLAKSLSEYRRQGAAKRIEQILEMRERLRGNEKFVNICELLETDSEALRDMTLLDKDNFVGFFEELCLLWNSKVFSDQEVLY